MLALFAARQTAHAFDLSYWAWQRSNPLKPAELSELASQNVRTIYWHVGELENAGETWRWKSRYGFPKETPPSLHFVPVVRLVSRETKPFSPASTAALVAALKPIATLNGDLQLDFDAPDRLLDDYAGALRKIHEVTSRLSITALPHWSSARCLHTLNQSADELFPMLYDYEAEPILPNDQAPQPLIVPAHITEMLHTWSACPIPWQAGLPCFARLTLYDRDGKSRGQIRNWNWDEIVLNHALAPNATAAGLGVFLLKAERSGTAIANSRMEYGDQLVVRMTDRAALREAIEVAKGTSARGVVLFRLPDSAASSGWTLHQLGHLKAGPNLALETSADGQSLALKNRGDGDLPPFWTAAPGMSSGYFLQLQLPSPVAREAEPGDFQAIVTEAQTAQGMRPVATPLATQLSFSFSALRAGEQIATGLIQLAPGASLRQARWRVSNADETWKPIE